MVIYWYMPSFWYDKTNIGSFSLLFRNTSVLFADILQSVYKQRDYREKLA
jgi:hypothetical protein